MDSVAFAFCDAVASALRAFHPLDDANSAEWGPWKSAFADHQTNRLNLSMYVCFNGGKWSYYCVKTRTGHSSRVTLEEVQESRRKFIRVYFIQFSNGKSESELSLDEIRSILKFLRPCVVPSAQLALSRTTLPKETLVELLSPFSATPFRSIKLFNYEEAFEDLLRKQIALDSLKEFEVLDEMQPPAIELRAAFKRIQRERSLNRVRI